MNTKLILLTTLFITGITYSQIDKKNKKQHFISVDSNFGYLISNKTDFVDYNDWVWTGGLRFQRRISNNLNIGSGFRITNLVSYFNDSSNRFLSYEIPLTIELATTKLGIENSSKTNNSLSDMGLMYEIGAYYSFNNKFVSPNSLVDNVGSGSNYGVSARITLGGKGFFDMYIEARKDLSKFRSDIDPNFDKFVISFGYNVYLFSF